MKPRSERYKAGEKALTIKQVQKLLLSFSNVQDKAIISLAVSTGLRRADIVEIKRKDYDPEKGTITFYENKKRRTRTVFIPSQETIQTLNMHLTTARPSPWLFPSPKVTGKFKNAHISDRHIYDIFNEHLAKVGIDPRPFHSLRATCYKLCQSAGWSIRKACELIGDTMEVAELHYNAPSTEEMQEISKEKPIF